MKYDKHPIKNNCIHQLTVFCLLISLWVSVYSTFQNYNVNLWYAHIYFFINMSKIWNEFCMWIDLNILCSLFIGYIFRYCITPIWRCFECGSDGISNQSRALSSHSLPHGFICSDHFRLVYSQTKFASTHCLNFVYK